MSIGVTTSKEIQFRKCLAKYYIRWFNDCHESAIYCRNHNDDERAERYLEDAKNYLTIIMENWDAIEYFTVNEDKAYIYDESLPEEFRGYN